MPHLPGHTNEHDCFRFKSYEQCPLCLFEGCFPCMYMHLRDQHPVPVPPPQTRAKKRTRAADRRPLKADRS